jgi:hypothetical protein
MPDSGWSQIFTYSSLKEELKDVWASIDHLRIAIDRAELHLNSLKYQRSQALYHLQCVEQKLKEQSPSDEVMKGETT